MLVVIRGAGDIASGIAMRLFRANIDVVMTDIANPTAIRRTVSFSPAVTEGEAAVEDVKAVLALNTAEALSIAQSRRIAVLVDPNAYAALSLAPDALVDAILAKKNMGTTIHDAPIVIGVGPGFTAGEDCHAVVETQRGHTLGRVYTIGRAAENTGTPGNIGGYTNERLLKAPCDGVFTGLIPIGAHVEAGDIVARVGKQKIHAEISGVLRGILMDGLPVYEGMKCGDIDPRGIEEYCRSVSDKALAIGGGVLEALFMLGNR